MKRLTIVFILMSVMVLLVSCNKEAIVIEEAIAVEIIPSNPLQKLTGTFDATGTIEETYSAQGQPTSRLIEQVSFEVLPYLKDVITGYKY